MQWIWDWLLNLQRVRLEPGGEVTVRLTQMWPILLALLAIVAVFVGVIYLYLRDGGNRAARVIGSALRITLLVLLLILIWQPVIRIESRKRDPGRVLVLIDTSSSMSTADHYAADDPAVAALLARNYPDGPTSQPESLRQQLADTLGEKPRLDLVRQALLDSGDQVVRTLATNNDLVVYSFDQSADGRIDLPQIRREDDRVRPSDGGSDERAEPLAESEALRVKTASEPLAMLRPEGAATSLGQSLTQVLSQRRGQRLAAVIVISDGRSTADSNLDEAIQMANNWQAPVPVHTVVVGAERPPRDLAVSQVKAEPVVFVNDLVAVETKIRQHGFTRPQQVDVELIDRESQEILAREQVTVGQADGENLPAREVDAELRYQPERPGVYKLAVRVLTADGSDVNPANDLSVTQIEVKDAQVKVLFIEDLPRWEYRYSKNSLLREKTVTLSTMLLSADETFAQEGNAPITRLPLSQEEWNAYDVVIMGDINPILGLTGEQMSQIESFVRDRGGGFAMIAGDRFAPYSYANTPLARLLPIEIDPLAGPDRVNRVAGFPIAVTPEGQKSPILRFEREPERNLDTIKAFPELFWHKPVAAVKPGAEPLAVHPTLTLPNGQPAPLLVAGRYGAGRTFFAATDETWRWRWHTGVGFFDTYWLQLVRYLSRSKLLETDRRFELYTGLTEYNRGQPVEVTLQVLDKSLVPAGSGLSTGRTLPETVKVTVRDSTGESIQELELQQAGPQSYVYSARFVPPTEGDFSIELERSEADARFGPPPALAGDSPDKLASMPRSQIHVAQSSREREQLSIDREPMLRLATRTGGRCITLPELPALAAGIADFSEQRDEPLSLPLWDTRLALILFALIITAEWIVRKKYNLQ